jgi:phospholipid transport system transporter-binding protein
MDQISLQSQGEGRFALVGTLSNVTVPGVWRDGAQQFGAHAELQLDLSGVRRSDSAGLVLLVEWMRYAKKHDKRITYLNIPDQMLAIARVSGLEQILPLVRG